MKNFWILRFLDLFRFFFAGYDYESIRLILQVKFTLSSRNPRKGLTVLKRDKAGSIADTLLYAFFGLIFAIPIALIFHKSIFLSLILFFSFNMMFLLLSLFNEFSISFFDLTDNELLLPTPLRPKELSIAKNFYILLFFVKTSLLLSTPSILLYGYFYGILPALFILVTLIFSTLFLISITSIFYGILLWKLSGEKLKDFITYLQIAVTVMGFTAYWFFNSSMTSVLDKFDTIIDSHYLYIYAPAWFAAMGKVLFDYKSSYLILSLIGISASVLGYYIYLKFIAPYYEANLFKIKKTEKISFIKKRQGVFSKLFSKFDFGPFYDFSIKILSSDRNLKQLIYPTIARTFIFSIIFPLINLKNKNIYQSKAYFSLYLVIVFSVQIFMVINHSAYFKAAWTFKYLPIETPKNLFKGAVLAIFLKFQSPLFLIISAIYLFIWKSVLIPFVVISYLNGIIVILLFLMMSDRILPFSQELKSNKALSARGSSYLLASMVLVPLLVGIHYVSTLFTIGAFILIPIQIVAIIALWKNYFENLTWENVKYD